MANNKESGTTSAPQVPNPYSGVGNIPNPSNYLFGTSSSSYHSDLNEYNHRVQSAQWDAQLALMADERRYAEEMYNKYNSPEAQARQMREAGLNPDLEGVQSSGFSSPQSAVPSGGVPGMSTGGDKPLALLFLQALPQAVHMATSIQGSILSLQDKKLAIDESMNKLAYSDFLGSLTPDMFNPKGEFIGDRNSSSFDNIRNRSWYLGENYSRRYRKSYQSAIESYFSSNMNQHYQDMYFRRQSGANARRGFLDIMSSHGFQLDDDKLVEILRAYNEVVFSTRKKRADNDKLSSDNDYIPELMSKANKKLDSNNSGDYFVGIVLYFLASILQGNISVNRETNGKYSGSIGF